MILKMTVRLQFYEDARFESDPKLMLYRSVLRYIHDLSCYQPACKCRECRETENCQYSILTGSNFQEYPGFLVRTDMFTSRMYRKQDILETDFYFIGKMALFSRFLNLYFEQSFRLAGFPYGVVSLEAEEKASRPVSIRKIFVQTAIESKDFLNSYNEMVSYYNQVYGCSYPFVFSHCKADVFEMAGPKVHLGTALLRMKGYAGTFAFDRPVLLDAGLAEMGIGRWNCIGGGQNETESYTEDPGSAAVK